MSQSFIIAVHNIPTDVYQNEINLCQSQDKDSMKIILLTKQDTSQVRPQLLKVSMTIIIIIIFRIGKSGCEVHILDPENFVFCVFQVNRLQIRCLSSMSLCFLLDVSPVSYLVQTQTNMVHISPFITVKLVFFIMYDF